MKNPWHQTEISALQGIFQEGLGFLFEGVWIFYLQYRFENKKRLT